MKRKPSKAHMKGKKPKGFGSMPRMNTLKGGNTNAWAKLKRSRGIGEAKPSTVDYSKLLSLSAPLTDEERRRLPSWPSVPAEFVFIHADDVGHMPRDAAEALKEKGHAHDGDAGADGHAAAESGDTTGKEAAAGEGADVAAAVAADTTASAGALAVVAEGSATTDGAAAGAGAEAPSKSKGLGAKLKHHASAAGAAVLATGARHSIKVDRIPLTLERARTKVGFAVSMQEELVLRAICFEHKVITSEAQWEATVRRWWEARQSRSIARLRHHFHAIGKSLHEACESGDTLRCQLGLHRLWEFSCRGELHSELYALFPHVMQVLASEALAEKHPLAINVLSSFARFHDGAKHLYSARLMEHLYKACEIAGMFRERYGHLPATPVKAEPEPEPRASGQAPTYSKEAVRERLAAERRARMAEEERKERADKRGVGGGIDETVAMILNLLAGLGPRPKGLAEEGNVLSKKYVHVAAMVSGPAVSILVPLTYSASSTARRLAFGCLNNVVNFDPRIIVKAFHRDFKGLQFIVDLIAREDAHVDEVRCCAAMLSRISATEEGIHLLVHDKFGGALLEMWRWTMASLKAVQLFMATMTLMDRFQLRVTEKKLRSIAIHIGPALWCMASYKVAINALNGAFVVPTRRDEEYITLARAMLSSADALVARHGMGFVANMAVDRRLAPVLLDADIMEHLLHRALQDDQPWRMQECAVCALTQLATVDTVDSRDRMWESGAFDVIAQFIDVCIRSREKRDDDDDDGFGGGGSDDDDDDEDRASRTVAGVPIESLSVIHLKTAAVGLMWLCVEVEDPQTRELGAVEIVARQLQLPDIALLRVSALTVWGLAHDAENRKQLGTSGALELMVQWTALLLLVENGREMELHGKSLKLAMRLAKQRNKAPAAALKLHEALLGALWLCAYDNFNVQVLALNNCVEVLADHLVEGAALTPDLMHMCIGGLWTMSQNPSARSRLVNSDTPMTVLDLAVNDETREELKVFSAGFLLELLRDSAVRKRVMKSRGMAFEEGMLLNFLSSDLLDVQEYGARMMARHIKSGRAKSNIADMDGCVLVAMRLEQTYRLQPRAEWDRYVLTLLHVMLNLSTEDDCQVQIAKFGIDALLRIAQDHSSAERQAFAARTIVNLKRNPANATAIYKLELELKGARWHERVTVPTDPSFRFDEEAALRALRGSDDPRERFKDWMAKVHAEDDDDDGRDHAGLGASRMTAPGASSASVFERGLGASISRAGSVAGDGGGRGGRLGGGGSGGDADRVPGLGSVTFAPSDSLIDNGGVGPPRRPRSAGLIPRASSMRPASAVGGVSSAVSVSTAGLGGRFADWVASTTEDDAAREALADANDKIAQSKKKRSGSFRDLGAGDGSIASIGALAATPLPGWTRGEKSDADATGFGNTAMATMGPGSTMRGGVTAMSGASFGGGSVPGTPTGSRPASASTAGRMTIGGGSRAGAGAGLRPGTAGAVRRSRPSTAASTRHGGSRVGGGGSKASSARYMLPAERNSDAAFDGVFRKRGDKPSFQQTMCGSVADIWDEEHLHHGFQLKPHHTHHHAHVAHAKAERRTNVREKKSQIEQAVKAERRRSVALMKEQMQKAKEAAEKAARGEIEEEHEDAASATGSADDGGIKGAGGVGAGVKKKYRREGAAKTKGKRKDDRGTAVEGAEQWEHEQLHWTEHKSDSDSSHSESDDEAEAAALAEKDIRDKVARKEKEIRLKKLELERRFKKRPPGAVPLRIAPGGITGASNKSKSFKLLQKAAVHVAISRAVTTHVSDIVGAKKKALAHQMGHHAESVAMMAQGEAEKLGSVGMSKIAMEPVTLMKSLKSMGWAKHWHTKDEEEEDEDERLRTAAVDGPTDGPGVGEGQRRRRGSHGRDAGWHDSDAPRSGTLLDLNEVGGKNMKPPVVKLTETHPFRWKPPIVSYGKPKSASGDAVPLYRGKEPITVVVAPQTERHRVQFDREPTEADSLMVPLPEHKEDIGKRRTVRMYKFEHTPGAVFCNRLYKHYRLPNGKTVHYYHEDDLHELVADTVVQAPTPPVHLVDIFQTALPRPPLPVRLQPSDLPPPLFPIPTSAPFPVEHTLPVEAGHRCANSEICACMGMVPGDDAIKFEITADDGDEPEPEPEPVKAGPPPPPWNPYGSIFEKRLAESMSRDFYDSDRVFTKAFKVDWGRCTTAERFQKFVYKELGFDMESHSEDDEKKQKATMKKMRVMMKKNYSLLCNVFDQYCSKGANPYALGYNAFCDFLDESGIVDQESKSVRQEHCDILFTMINVEKKASTDHEKLENKFNSDRAFMRFEFMEAIIRLSHAKYGGKLSPDKALKKLIDVNLKAPFAKFQPVMDSNSYRKERLYTEKVNVLFEKHGANLRLFHELFSPSEKGTPDASRTRRMSVDEWLTFLERSRIIDDNFTRKEAKLAFVAARMHVIDELRHAPVYRNITFTDFLEALGRVADSLDLPTDADLKMNGFHNAAEYAHAFSGGQLDRKRRASGDFFAPNTRPLHDKLEKLIHIIYSNWNKTGAVEMTEEDIRYQFNRGGRR